MRLFEFEAKELWRDHGIAVPEPSVLLRRSELETLGERIPALPGYTVKAQTLGGNRKAGGLVVHVNDNTAALVAADAIFRTPALSPALDAVLIEPTVPHTGAEYYVAVTYDTRTRRPTLILHPEGGSGVESRGVHAHLTPIALPATEPRVRAALREAFQRFAPPADLVDLVEVGYRLWSCFWERDCTLAEINPLVRANDGRWVALDAKVELDEDAAFRHQRIYAERHNLGRLPSGAEIRAWQIDRDDHRGVAGSSYVDLDGDIAVLASGGGASLAAMDALLAYGGAPANYTEYSGNPPREKVRRLAEIVLAKPNLAGCWIVGATANFTDILETLSGFLDALRAVHPKPDYPILVRRAGPHDTEAFTRLREAASKEGYDFHLYGADTPMLSTAKTMVDLAQRYRDAHPR